MIEEGVVRKVDKEGNGQADAAAGKGSKEAQESLASLATYSSRHKRYKALLERTNVFMMKMIAHEKVERQKMEQERKVETFAEGKQIATKKKQGKGTQRKPDVCNERPRTMQESASSKKSVLQERRRTRRAARYGKIPGKFRVE